MNVLVVIYDLEIDFIYTYLSREWYLILRPPVMSLVLFLLSLQLLFFFLDVENFTSNYSITDHAQPLPPFEENQHIILT